MSIAIGDYKASLVRNTFRCISLLAVVLICGGMLPVYSQPVAFQFEGNKNLGAEQLSEVATKCLSQYGTSSDMDDGKIAYCLGRVQSFLTANGYLRATVTERQRMRTNDGLQIAVQIYEEAKYRLGTVTINGATLFPPTRLRQMLHLKTGDIANNEMLSEWSKERLKKAYYE